MPFPSQSMLFQWEGSFPSGDIFAGSMRFATDSTRTGLVQNLDALESDGVMDDLITDLTAFWQSDASAVPNYAVIHQAKWNRIDEAGHYLRDTTRLRDNLSVAGGTPTSGVRFPAQVAWVTSWGTTAQRGLANKGRTYWPTVMVPRAQDLMVADSLCASMAAAAASLIEAWGNFPGIDQSDVQPVVGSQGAGSRPGVFRYINHVAVGQRLDILRSRANRQGEGLYQSAPVGGAA